jgi:hypothetical protein
VGSHAGDNIAEAVLAIATRRRLSTLSALIHPYPTLAEGWKRAADLRVEQDLIRWQPWLRRYLRWRR